MNTAAPMLELAQVSRRLAGRDVVRELSLRVARGRILGLLGVNGAGKTTTLRMACGVLAPSRGQVRVEGRDLYEQPQLARRHIGYLPETPPLHGELTTREYLSFCARLHGVARSAVAAAVERAIERCALGEVARRLTGALSKGYRQRVGVAQAIVHEPGLIVLDEPASGLDPVQALRLRELIRSLGHDHALIVSTHVLPDVAACCDEVAILHRGTLRHVGPVAAAADDRYEAQFSTAVDATLWQGLPLVVAAAEQHDALHWQVRLAAGTGGAALIAALVARGAPLCGLRRASPSLEATFLAIAASDTAQAA